MSSMLARTLPCCLIAFGLFTLSSSGGDDGKDKSEPKEEPLVFAKVRVLGHCNGIPASTGFSTTLKEVEYIKKLELERYFRIPVPGLGKNSALYAYTWVYYNPGGRIPAPEDSLALSICVPYGTLEELTKPLLKLEYAEREKQFVMIAEGRLLVGGEDETLRRIVEGACLFGSARIERPEKAPADLTMGFMHIEGEIVNLDQRRGIRRDNPWEIHPGIRNGLEPLELPQSYFALPPIKRGLVQVVAGRGRSKLFGVAMTIKPKLLLLRDDSEGRPVLRAEIGRGGGDAELKDVAKHPKVQQLVVFQNATLTGEGLKAIGRMKQLQQLRLPLDDKITDQSFKAVTELKQLRELVLTGPGINDARLKELPQLKGLQELLIGDCESKALTKEGLLALKGCESLRTLRFVDCRAASEETDIKQLQDAMPGCKISVQSFVVLP